MKKTIFLFGLTLFFIGCSNTDLDLESTFPNDLSPESYSPTHIKLEDALKNAEELFGRMERTGTRGRTKTRIVKSIETLGDGGKTRSSNEEPLYYVVNYAGDAGFAILGADTRLDEVYAFSDTGSLNLSDTTYNQGLKDYISRLPDKPSWPIWELDSTFQQFNPNVDNTVDLSYKIGPLLSSAVRKWDQLEPFNYYTPQYYDSLYNLTRNTPVGCTAVACAQIMSFFKWPNSYRQFTFDWDQMVNLTTFYYCPTTLSIARLMYELGTSDNLSITYDKDGSGSNIRANGKRTFKNFGYNVSGEFKSYSEKDLVSHLNTNQTPLISRGTQAIGGHAWVCDGLYCDKKRGLGVDGEYTIYGEGYFFHIVWGWKGRANGYFKYGSSFTVNHKYKESDDCEKEYWETHPRLYDEVKFTDLEFWGGFTPAM